MQTHSVLQILGSSIITFSRDDFNNRRIHTFQLKLRANCMSTLWKFLTLSITCITTNQKTRRLNTKWKFLLSGVKTITQWVWYLKKYLIVMSRVFSLSTMDMSLSIHGLYFIHKFKLKKINLYIQILDLLHAGN